LDKLRAIQTFIAVADGGGFAPAARNLGVSAATVTRMVSELESELGVALLQRTTRKVTLTDSGKRYLEDVKNVLENLQVADEAAQGAHGTPQGTLRLTAPTMFGNIYLTPILSDYLDRYPNVLIDTVFIDRIVNIVEEQIDVSVRIGELPDSSLIATRVGEVQLQVCGSAEYLKKHGQPKSPDDLLQHQTIGLTIGNFQSKWKFSNGKSLRPAHRISYNSIPAAIASAESGVGLVRALSYQVSPNIDAGSLQPVLQEFAPPPIPINVVHGQGRRSNAKVRSFVDLAVDTLRSNAHLNYQK